jgi:hypothetical protein
MSLTFVNIKGQHVATITRQHRQSEYFDRTKPWLLLLHNTGAVNRFPSHRAAREHAVKLWAPCTFTKT